MRPALLAHRQDVPVLQRDGPEPSIGHWGLARLVAPKWLHPETPRGKDGPAIDRRKSPSGTGHGGSGARLARIVRLPDRGDPHRPASHRDHNESRPKMD